jgi:hypothetical protein
MKTTEYKFEVIYDNSVLGVITVKGYEDNAKYLAYSKLHTITNINHCLIDLKLME